jgi:hypothetical protein
MRATDGAESAGSGLKSGAAERSDVRVPFVARRAIILSMHGRKEYAHEHTHPS